MVEVSRGSYPGEKIAISLDSPLPVPSAEEWLEPPCGSFVGLWICHVGFALTPWPRRLHATVFSYGGQ